MGRQYHKIDGKGKRQDLTPLAIDPHLNAGAARAILKGAYPVSIYLSCLHTQSRSVSYALHMSRTSDACWGRTSVLWCARLFLPRVPLEHAVRERWSLHEQSLAELTESTNRKTQSTKSQAPPLSRWCRVRLLTRIPREVQRQGRRRVPLEPSSLPGLGLIRSGSGD